MFAKGKPVVLEHAFGSSSGHRIGSGSNIYLIHVGLLQETEVFFSLSLCIWKVAIKELLVLWLLGL